MNILPFSMLRKLSKLDGDLIHTNVSVCELSRNATRTKWVLPIELKVGNNVEDIVFFVLENTLNYNALLGRDWRHSNCCVPSLLHLLLLF